MKRRQTSYDYIFFKQEKPAKGKFRINRFLQQKLQGKRFRVRAVDSIRLGYVRALIQALQTQNTLLKDAEIYEINKRITALEESQKLRTSADVQEKQFFNF